jgi:autotransporter-associated beta strand protein
LVGALQPASITVDAAADYTFAGAGSITGPLSFTKTNSGALVVLTANSYAGVTTIAQGTIQLGNGVTAGSLGSGSVVNNGSLVVTEPNSSSLANPISGTGALVQAGPGTLILAASNSYGPTVITSGTLQIGTGGTLGIGDVTNNGTLAFNSANAVSVGGAISGVGDLLLSGSGTLTLSNNNTYSGGTMVNAGTLSVRNANGSATGAEAVTVNNGGTLAGNGTIGGPVLIASGGTLSPGAPTGILTVNNALTLNPGAVLSFALGTNSDKCVVNGDLALNGNLNVVDAGGLGNSTNTLFTYSGTLSLGSLTLGSLPNGRLFSLDTNTPGKVNLIVGVIATNVAAFPGAVGFGGGASGGRGGSIYHVTTLADSGAGSFRDAVSQGKRIVIFDVGGYINLSSTVLVQDNITIAGQTAPGDGIGVMGREVSFNGNTNIICRHFRFRQGDFDPDSSKSGINLLNATNLIFDHISIEFAQYDDIDAVGSSAITVQNSIIGNPIGQQFGAHTETLGGTYAWYNNLFANSHNRNPLAKINTIFVNNVNYNYQAAYTVADTSGNFSHDIINNYFIVGPATSSPGNDFYQMNSGQSIYASGNLRDSNEDGLLNGSATSPSGVTVLGSPWSPLTAAIPTLNTASAFKRVLSGSGALPRDQVDSLVLDQTRTLGNAPTGTGPGTAGPDGGLYTHQSQTGLGNSGYGIINGGTAPTDTDGDGLPDYWETAMGLDPSNPNDSTNLTLAGYQQIEIYLNWLGGPHATSPQNSFMDYDLLPYTSGFTNGQIYTLSSPTNGGVVLLSDGHTARFTPNIGFLGLGSFKFTVTDSAGSSMSDTVGILVTVPPLPLAPSFTSTSVVGANLVMSCSGGTTNSAYYLLTSSNLLQWSRLSTVYFDMGGNLVITDLISPSTVTRFYRLRSP